jgi:hypothetical protein
MNTPTLGKACFTSRLGHTINDDVRIPERIEIGAEPGLQFGQTQLAKSLRSPQSAQLLLYFI